MTDQRLNNYLFKFVIVVKSSISPWKVSNKMESTNIYTMKHHHHGHDECMASKLVTCVYHPTWRTCVWNEIWNQGLPGGSYQTFGSLNANGNSSWLHNHPRTPPIPSSLMGTHRRPRFPLGIQSGKLVPFSKHQFSKLVRLHSSISSYKVGCWF
jgi:hypothetical protein